MEEEKTKEIRKLNRLKSRTSSNKSKKNNIFAVTVAGLGSGLLNAVAVSFIV